MNWTALFGSKAVLEAENARLRRTLADRDTRIAQLSAALDDALDREALHSLTAPHERLTPAAVLDRYGRARAEHPALTSTPIPAPVGRGEATQSNARPWLRPLDATATATAAAAGTSRDRRRTR
ncbi:hypothetical protein [Nocardia otitidiscaviarum]|uniref:hypothetical protein n=1 Tax=Nocardia otitidiscaviarum TaxID=1823 RepID=UPI002458BB1D|nr:hypothetical protein [Nocardia otitidiscaviarum]